MIADVIRTGEGLEPVQPDGIYNGRTRILHEGRLRAQEQPTRTATASSSPGAVKGDGSVNYGIQLLQQQEIHVRRAAPTSSRSYRNYVGKKS